MYLSPLKLKLTHIISNNKIKNPEFDNKLLSIEGLSVLAASKLEDQRIGVSFTEKHMVKKDFYMPPEIPKMGLQDEYLELCKLSSCTNQTMQKELQRGNAVADYCWLTSLKTNSIILNGNIRALNYMIQRCSKSELSELNIFAKQLYELLFPMSTKHIKKPPITKVKSAFNIYNSAPEAPSLTALYKHNISFFYRKIDEETLEKQQQNRNLIKQLLTDLSQGKISIHDTHATNILSIDSNRLQPSVTLLNYYDEQEYLDMLSSAILFENDENLLDINNHINSVPDDLRIGGTAPNLEEIKKGMLSSLLNKKTSLSDLEDSTAEVDESVPNTMRMIHILEYWDKLFLRNQTNTEEFSNIKKGNTEQQFLLDVYNGKRMVRSDKLGRAFEFIDYTFEVESSFCVNRQLNRHRLMNKINNKVITARNSYESFIFPNEIMQNQLLFTEYKNLIDKSFELYRKIIECSKDYYTAQYVLPQSVKTRLLMKVNARQLDYMLSQGTNSAPQIHDEFRLVCQQLFTTVESVHPNITQFFKFCDMEIYPQGRQKQMIPLE